MNSFYKEWFIVILVATCIIFPLTFFSYTHPHFFDWMKIEEQKPKGTMWVRQRNILGAVEVCRDCTIEQARIIAGNNCQLELREYY
jgi:hypothetical protein